VLDIVEAVPSYPIPAKGELLMFLKPFRFAVSQLLILRYECELEPLGRGTVRLGVGYGKIGTGSSD
jgi:hypothetical protein